MADFRSLCARMADELDYYRQLLMDDRRETHALAAEARAALAEPQPPADGEVGELVAQLRRLAPRNPVGFSRYALTRAADLLERLAQDHLPGIRKMVEPTDEAVECWAEDQGFIRGYAEHPCGFWIDTGDIVKIARAVIARWSRPAPQPIPVTERLPEVGDCDADECCWWLYPETDKTLLVWVLGYGTDDWSEEQDGPKPTHWLPAHALPVPLLVEANDLP